MSTRSTAGIQGRQLIPFFHIFRFSCRYIRRQLLPLYIHGQLQVYKGDNSHHHIYNVNCWHIRETTHFSETFPRNLHGQLKVYETSYLHGLLQVNRGGSFSYLHIYKVNCSFIREVPLTLHHMYSELQVYKADNSYLTVISTWLTADIARETILTLPSYLQQVYEGNNSYLTVISTRSSAEIRRQLYVP